MAYEGYEGDMIALTGAMAWRPRHRTAAAQGGTYVV